ncbi:ABC transporter ATP-binding protein [Undibacterium sp. SXout20W]|uniref:ABC transporter ATP-binding protein n=1 Tax=Undibacterium sp. SXout20W TaxID=3413051 RepID=UPI003BF05AA1
MTQVDINSVSVRIASNEIIHALNLTVQPGEFLVLLGPSGCGKSTLLHAIAGLHEVSAGDIYIGGDNMTYAEPCDRGIGMVFQSYALYPTMTVEENMSFGLRVRGISKNMIKHRIDEVATMLQLYPMLKRKPSELSGGQRQRVAIGRALMRDARVFLFDEPLSNLDAKLRTELRRELKLLHKKLATTMIYVTHDQVEAMTLATRIAVMKGGAIQQIGTPTEVYERPETLFVAGFLGAPCMNFFDVKLTSASASAPQSGQWKIGFPFDINLTSQQIRHGAVEGQQVVLGVRPEHIHLSNTGAYVAHVTFVEPMGSSVTVWLDFHGTKFSAVVHGDCEYDTDQLVRFDIESAKISIFDQQTGQRL